MNNVIRLFERKNAGFPLPEAERIAIVTMNLLASSAQLDHAVKELSKRIDVIENAIDSLDDTEARSRLGQSTSLDRKVLSKAALELSQAIRKLPALQPKRFSKRQDDAQ
jgi:hypothetical protein